MFRKLGYLLASLTACAILIASSAHADGLVINGPAPDFRATTFDGKDVTLADYKGQVVIINFWATWCGPCKKELPLLDSYYAAANQRGYGLKILAVTTEDSIPIQDLKPLAANVRFDMARHFHGPYGALKAVPTNYIIDRNGILRYAKAAAFDIDSLNDVLIPLLQQPIPNDTTAGPTKAAYKPN
jgi:cytochrome c biogenesis protein CcmG/thiol:disulfide interchange protein DsbE